MKVYGAKATEMMKILEPAEPAYTKYIRISSVFGADLRFKAPVNMG